MAKPSFGVRKRSLPLPPVVTARSQGALLQMTIGSGVLTVNEPRMPRILLPRLESIFHGSYPTNLGESTGNFRVPVTPAASDAWFGQVGGRSGSSVVLTMERPKSAM